MGLGIDEPGDGILKIEGDSGNVADVDAQGNLCVKVESVSPNDFLSKVSANDTTGDYLKEKIVAGSSKVAVAEVNDGLDEDLSIDVVEANIDHDALNNFVANEHIDWTAPGAGTIDPSNYNDNDTTDHTALTNIGTNTHAQIDTHIADTSIHYTQASISVTASQVSDFDAEVSNNPSVTANTAKVTNATHTGEVTGSSALTVDKTAITNKTTIPGASGDFLLVSDTSDSGNLKKIDVNDLLGGGGGGDYANGGEAGGADRTLGNTDNFALAFLTNALERLKIMANGVVEIASSVSSDYLVKIQNTNASGHGLQVKAGEVDGDIILDLEDSDGTFNILQVEADQGYIVHGKTYAQTIIDNGVAYGYDNQRSSGTAKDINAQFGMYRVGGEQPWQEVSATNEVTTSSTSYTLTPNMTYTSPSGGTYIVQFSASGRAQSQGQLIQYAIFSNGTKVAHSERDYGLDLYDSAQEDQRVPFVTQAVVTLTAGQVVQVRWLTNLSTCRMFERNMILTKVRAD